jgi:flagellar export protein FliJ
VQPFRFRLQRVLEWQQKICDTEEEQLKLERAQLGQVRQHMESLEGRTASIEQEFLSQASLSSSDVKAFAEFRTSTVRSRQVLLGEEKKQEAAVAAQLEKYLNERRRLETLEKLKSRALQEHTLEETRELEALGLESYLSAFTTRRSTE